MGKMPESPQAPCPALFADTGHSTIGPPTFDEYMSRVALEASQARYAANWSPRPLQTSSALYGGSSAGYGIASAIILGGALGN